MIDVQSPGVGKGSLFFFEMEMAKAGSALGKQKEQSAIVSPDKIQLDKRPRSSLTEDEQRKKSGEIMS